MDKLLEFLKKIDINTLAGPILIILVLSMMVLPLPPLLLDIFFTFNIAVSIIVLMVGVNTREPLEFSSFPSVLLITTLLRLSLNVASSRVILLEGHTGTAAAGAVIESFAHFLIGDNITIGIVVFIILTIINFVVITKGAGRVSEVTARFILDAMPGKQMAIDADLNAGLINQEEARRRREEVGREADFYGSMDGASKFVRGDAVAGILILRTDQSMFFANADRILLQATEQRGRLIAACRAAYYSALQFKQDLAEQFRNMERELDASIDVLQFMDNSRLSLNHAGDVGEPVSGQETARHEQ